MTLRYKIWPPHVTLVYNIAFLARTIAFCAHNNPDRSQKPVNGNRPSGKIKAALARMTNWTINQCARNSPVYGVFWCAAQNPAAAPHHRSLARSHQRKLSRRRALKTSRHFSSQPDAMGNRAIKKLARVTRAARGLSIILPLRPRARPSRREGNAPASKNKNQQRTAGRKRK